MSSSTKIDRIHAFALGLMLVCGMLIFIILSTHEHRRDREAYQERVQKREEESKREREESNRDVNLLYQDALKTNSIDAYYKYLTAALETLEMKTHPLYGIEANCCLRERMMDVKHKLIQLLAEDAIAKDNLSDLLELLDIFQFRLEARNHFFTDSPVTYRYAEVAEAVSRKSFEGDTLAEISNEEETLNYYIDKASKEVLRKFNTEQYRMNRIEINKMLEYLVNYRDLVLDGAGSTVTGTVDAAQVYNSLDRIQKTLGSTIYYPRSSPQLKISGGPLNETWELYPRLSSSDNSNLEIYVSPGQYLIIARCGDSERSYRVSIAKSTHYSVESLKCEWTTTN